jgi:ATP-dependent DNA helicase RecQ
MNRSNIAMKVDFVASIEEKKEKLLMYVSELQGPGIIYCSSRSWTEALTQLLKENGIQRVQYYHGGMEPNERMLVQQQFLENQLDIICCTSAFGMGVNKSNVRFVIHFHTPTQLEAYVQEIGRSGRDQRNSIAILLYAEGDDDFAHSLLEIELPSSDTILYCLSYLRNHDQAIPLKQVESHFLYTVGVQETHWRFIRYYLYRENAVENEHVEPWKIPESLHETIVTAVNKRLRNKHDKYRAMKGFIETKECRRHVLLGYFDETGKSEFENCCDCCGLDLENYKKTNGEQEQWTFQGWELELARLLRQGEI